MDKKRLIVSLIVAACISFIIFLVSNDFGIAWDEPVYMQHGDGYVDWLKQPTFAGIDKYFEATTNDVHPPFRKLIAGMTHEGLATSLRIIDNTRGYRISSLVFVIPFITLFTYIAIGRVGYAVGLLVPFMLSLLPHVLYLTPLVTLDYAIMVLWFIAVISGIKGAHHRGWLTVSGICIGLTMLTKLHGYVLFIPIVGFWIWHKRRMPVRRISYLVLVALTVYIIGWPWLWISPVSHLTRYFHLQSTFESVPEFIFGKTYIAAPWWYIAVMFLVTTPAVVLFLFFIGAWWAIRKGGMWDRAMLANALFPIVFFSLPWVYRHDWIRLFLPAYPFAALIVGRGIMQCKRKFIFFIIIAWLATLYFSVIRIHPWESSYYNELVGGVSGAERLGFETEYWGNAYQGVLPWMNEHKESTMCVSPTTHPFYYYQAMGQIEAEVVFNADRNVCDYAVILMRQGFFIKNSSIATIVRTQKPVYSVLLDGVPLVGIYDIRNIRE